MVNKTIRNIGLRHASNQLSAEFFLFFLHLMEEEFYNFQIYGWRSPVSNTFIGFEGRANIIRQVNFLTFQVSFLHSSPDIIIDNFAFIFAISIIKLNGIIFIQLSHIDELRNGFVGSRIKSFAE